ncbi:hypothetical protein DL770_004198 [Monosporascus sp. CRB-9-2]|nr:hypothetical protein DL770_004198 [Monosporascus sp. CRB-9-2]
MAELPWPSSRERPCQPQRLLAADGVKAEHLLRDPAQEPSWRSPGASTQLAIPGIPAARVYSIYEFHSYRRNANEVWPALDAQQCTTDAGEVIRRVGAMTNSIFPSNKSSFMREHTIAEPRRRGFVTANICDRNEVGAGNRTYEHLQQLFDEQVDLRAPPTVNRSRDGHLRRIPWCLHGYLLRHRAADEDVESPQKSHLLSPVPQAMTYIDASTKEPDNPSQRPPPRTSSDGRVSCGPVTKMDICELDWWGEKKGWHKKDYCEANHHLWVFGGLSQGLARDPPAEQEDSQSELFAKLSTITILSTLPSSHQHLPLNSPNSAVARPSPA